ncbi:MAG: pyrroline-5-carboxylate reductase [Hyphomicrobiales bacterium]
MSVAISKARPLVLVGAGKMGGAMLQGWLESGLPEGSVHVIDPGLDERQRTDLEARGVVVHAVADDVPTPLLLMLAIKPQMMSSVLPGLAGFAKRENAHDMMVLSVAAGTTVATLSSAFGSQVLIIRAMPNTPALVGRGVTALYPAATLLDEQKSFVAELLAAIGIVVWVDNEAAIDAVTAVSGSGPAYVFHMVEAMAAAAEKQGLPADVAMILARETVVGSGELLHQSADPAATLRKNVTSPNGTTAAGLGVLMADDGLGPLVEKTVRAAHDRAIELGKEA